MNIDLKGNKTSEYEVGDLIKTRYGHRIIAKDGNSFALMSLDGIIITDWRASIDEVLFGYEVLEHYKNNELKLTLNK